MKIIDYCTELDTLSGLLSLQQIHVDFANAQACADLQEYLIKITLSEICNQNKKEGIGATFSDKIAASDPKYLEQIKKFQNANLAARMSKASLDSTLLRIKSLHVLISAEKTILNPM